MATTPRPLPSKAANELITHMTTCFTCKTAKLSRGGYCSRGTQLIHQTLKERHG